MVIISGVPIFRIFTVALTLELIAPDTSAHNELPHLDLHCLPSSLGAQMIQPRGNFFKYCRHKFYCLFFWHFKGLILFDTHVEYNPQHWASSKEC